MSCLWTLHNWGRNPLGSCVFHTEENKSFTTTTARKSTKSTVCKHLKQSAESITTAGGCDVLKHQQSILETARKQHENHKIKRKIKLKLGYRNASCKENRTVFSVTSFPVSFTYNKHERLDLSEATQTEKQNKTKTQKLKAKRYVHPQTSSDECAWTLWFLRQMLQHSLWAGILHFRWLILAL